ncbi:MAG: polysaccharide deacetylase [bacterium]|nr:polysaccharide deacetylase [bacterium]
MGTPDVSTPVWPVGKRCAVALTFDFDAEALWIGNDPANADDPGVMALGHYGARVGVPKILELLSEEELPATFFIPGVVAEQYPGHIHAVLEAGHEVAHHGYTHIPADPSIPGRVEEQIDRGLEALDKVAGIVPLGYRAPDGVSSHLGQRLLTDRGFLYDSSLKDHFAPYRIILQDGSPGPVEIPEQPTLDDWAFGSSSSVSYKVMQSKQQVLSMWNDEFLELRTWGGVATLLCHPQITGRPMRLSTLRDFIAFTRTFDDVWYATCGDIARNFVAYE